MAALVGSVLSLSVMLLLAPTGLGSGSDDPVLPIVGGNEVTSCQFPSAVSILEGDETPVMCTGTLVHPSVVTLAAHCVTPERPIVAVGFGEQGQGAVGPARQVSIVDCVPHPNYEFDETYDVAYCTLAVPVLDVPIVPMMTACEAQFLEPGVEVTIIGYGSTWGSYDSGELESEGVGPKRYTTQTIWDIDFEVYMVGPNGSQSACFGDSGGPAMVQLPDGTWRVFGAASRLFDPGGFPDPVQAGNFCGVGVTYGLLSNYTNWLESETGRDLTPCYADNGAFDPSPGCGLFPMAPEFGVGDWDNACAGGVVGGGGQVCADLIDPIDSDTDSGSSTGDGSASDTAFTTGPGPDPSAGGTTGVPTEPGIPLPPADPMSAGTGGSSTDPPADDQGFADRGCSCTTGTGGGFGAALVLLGLGAIRRRR